MWTLLLRQFIICIFTGIILGNSWGIGIEDFSLDFGSNPLSSGWTIGGNWNISSRPGWLTWSASLPGQFITASLNSGSGLDLHEYPPPWEMRIRLDLPERSNTYAIGIWGNGNSTGLSGSGAWMQVFTSWNGTNAKVTNNGGFGANANPFSLDPTVMADDPLDLILQFLQKEPNATRWRVMIRSPEDQQNPWSYVDFSAPAADYLNPWGLAIEERQGFYTYIGGNAPPLPRTYQVDFVTFSRTLTGFDGNPVPTATPSPPTPTTTPVMFSLWQVQGVSGINTRYSATVPDTLDLAERCKLAQHAIISSVDSEDPELSWWGVNLYHNPPYMWNQVRLYGKFTQALPLLRIPTGTSDNLIIDDAWKKALLRKHRYGSVMHGPEEGRQLIALAIHYILDRDSRFFDAGKLCVDRTLTALSQQSGYGYIPLPDGSMPKGWDATFSGWTLQGQAEFYRATGYPPALQAAMNLAYFLKDYAQVFDTDGHFIARHYFTGRPALHFHHNANALEALSEYALASHDETISEFVRKSYEWAKTTGNPTTGFFPEYIEEWPDDRGVIDCEACCVIDMIMIALNLARLGLGDKYWDDVDTYLRNMFAEMQITDSAWIAPMVAKLTYSPTGFTDHVSERVLGDFAGWSPPNDFLYPNLNSIQHCCLGNSARALYYSWRETITFSTGILKVNLLLNRASPWMDMDSYIPFEGRVILHPKTAVRKLMVRIPGWVSLDDVELNINGFPTIFQWEGRYAVLDGVHKDSELVFTFHITERTVTEYIGGGDYSLILRGNTVVSISPPGTFNPYYQREYYQNGIIRYHVVDRYISDTLVGW